MYGTFDLPVYLSSITWQVKNIKLRAWFLQRQGRHIACADIKRYLKLDCSVGTVRNALKSNMAGPPYAAGREDRKRVRGTRFLQAVVAR